MTWQTDTMHALDALDLRIVHGDHYLIAQCDHATLAAAMREAGLVADALVVDAPYSERTHSGHDDGTMDANRVSAWASRRLASGVSKVRSGSVAAIAERVARKGQERRTIDYAAWDDFDVSTFVRTFAPVTRGWFCSLTDHVLAGAWDAAMVGVERYTFSPIACIESGSRIRLTGDGPPQWATWLVVSRPRTAEFLASWHAFRREHGVCPRGAYVGGKEAKAVAGGKPLWLMRAIVGDYSRPGDLVVDPCMGAGTTLVAAVELGRRAIGCEPDAGRFELAAKRLAKARPQLRMRLDVEAVEGEQAAWSMPRGGEK